MEIKRKYSILYPDFDGVEYKQLSETTCHDLALDLLCKQLTEDSKERKLIMETISHMTADPRVAAFRQKVFSDILRLPDLRKQMVALFDKFEFIRSYGVYHLNIDEKKGLWHLLRRMDELKDYIIQIFSKEKVMNSIHDQKTIRNSKTLSNTDVI